jgi:hypothetical protein
MIRPNAFHDVWLSACRVMGERDIGARPALAERHLQRVEHERRAHVGSQLPTDDLARPDVDDKGEEDQALPAAQVGEIGDPKAVRTVRLEVALYEVGTQLCAQIRLRRAPRLAAALGALDAGRAHQSLPLAAAGRPA